MIRTPLTTDNVAIGAGGRLGTAAGLSPAAVLMVATPTAATATTVSAAKSQILFVRCWRGTVATAGGSSGSSVAGWESGSVVSKAGSNNALPFATVGITLASC